MTTKNLDVLTGTVENIVDVWNRASDQRKIDGALWYDDARQIGRDLDETFKLASGSGAGILAALSPSTAWTVNVSEAWALCENGWSRRQSKANNLKALSIRDGASPDEILGGNKVRAFYACIVDNDQKRACIDRHAVSVYVGRHVTDAEQKGLARVGVYDRIAEAYQTAADQIGVSVEVVQAVTWVQWRAEKGLS